MSTRAQAPAVGFYARQGYLPHGQRFDEAGIEHLTMRRRLDGPDRIEDRASALACITALCHQARRSLCIYSRTLDPGLFDAPPVLDALRPVGVKHLDMPATPLRVWEAIQAAG